SGYPGEVEPPEVPEGVLGPDKWGGMFSSRGTAFAGAWGVSFPRNLTPDVETGLGSWTAEIFIKALRTGKDMGEGRDILPPMPWWQFRQATDEDLKAIFAYLQSIEPVYNPVPDPISPTGERLETLRKPPK
ncbi:MAG: diheme cytochrome c-553, partial [Gemmatimonadota bacterium]